VELAARQQRLESLRERGVHIPAPEQVYVGEEVELDRIAATATLFSGTRLQGARTYVGPGVTLGAEGPVVAVDSVFAQSSGVASGYVEGAVLLTGATLGANAHVRPGTLLEEQASTGHCVGLKQTVLLSFVTLGSLINFCDVLMAGGTSRRDHSEVGSGFIHFNFTPWGKSGDKATPSLVGDVVRGVFLDQKRIFLGGSSGLVGPRLVGYGSIAAAGQVVRRNVGDEQLVLEVPGAIDRKVRPPLATRVTPILRLNAAYIGQLVALREWYRQVRLARASAADERLVLAEALVTLEACIAERWKRVAAFLTEHEQVAPDPGFEVDLACPLEVSDVAATHVDWVQARSPAEVEAGRGWLQEVVDRVLERLVVQA
jgi:UDP-N-acetylglucosamine/UDP-N-acetylgalactosamine diphosphorylase